LTPFRQQHAETIKQLLRIPVDADRDSAVMPTGIPLACRPAFRSMPTAYLM